jgi:glycine/D-amino acid oxidase-like deaminating enzyme
VRTLLVEQGDLASGASGGNFGRAQILDSELGLSLELNLLSHAQLLELEAALDADLGYTPSGYMLLIESERQWALIEERAAALQAAGVQAQLLDGEALSRLEPHLAPGTSIGALYHEHEASVNPFALVHAYARRGRDRGLDIWTHTEVTAIESHRERVTGMNTSRGRIGAGSVVLAAGAWTRRLARSAGAEIPVLWVHGEALVTEPLPPFAMNGLISASFFEETEGAEPLPPFAMNGLISASFFEETEGAEGQTVGFCLVQRPEGNALIGEAAAVTEHLSRRVTGTALPAIAVEARRRFPALRRANVIRGWAIPVPFTADNRPLLGPVDGLENLLVATGLKSTIILPPLVGELVKDMIIGNEVDPRLDTFSPTREMGPAVQHSQQS